MGRKFQIWRYPPGEGERELVGQGEINGGLVFETEDEALKEILDRVVKDGCIPYLVSEISETCVADIVETALLSDPMALAYLSDWIGNYGYDLEEID